MFYEWYKCLAMLTNIVADYECARMKRQHDACVAYLHIHIAGICLFFYLQASTKLAYCPSNVYSLSAFVLYLTELSIRMLANFYNRRTITINALSSTRMACHLITIML